jgi:hypothetical protein
MVYIHQEKEEDRAPFRCKFAPALSLQFRFGAHNVGRNSVSGRAR